MGHPPRGASPPLRPLTPAGKPAAPAHALARRVAPAPPRRRPGARAQAGSSAGSAPGGDESPTPRPEGASAAPLDAPRRSAADKWLGLPLQLSAALSHVRGRGAQRAGVGGRTGAAGAFPALPHAVRPLRARAAA
jgi:hypothetical protein